MSTWAERTVGWAERKVGWAELTVGWAERTVGGHVIGMQSIRYSRETGEPKEGGRPYVRSERRRAREEKVRVCEKDG